jgi:pyruvate,water dikinase
LSHVAWFHEFRKTDIAAVGGKAANLGELTAAGIQVPPGFVVTADAYAAVLKESGLGPKIATTLATAGDKPSSAAAHIQRLFAELQIPQHLSAQITSAYQSLGQGPVAVRSSATAEDLLEASFAGQQSTYLNVLGEAHLLTAVRDCWASLFEERAIDYRHRKGFDHHDTRIAVVVQQMVQSERSGVMFTMNPVSGDAGQMVIEVVFGLGEAVVSGLVTPDMFIVDAASGLVLEREIAEQERQLVRNASASPDEEPNHWCPVPREHQRAAKLSDAEVLTLAALGRQLEEHYGCPQDIEWATAGGQFYVLQSRPVTATGI